MEYALGAIVCLAGELGQPKTVRQLAQLTGVPSDYLAKVLQALVRARFIESSRGARGGYALIVSPRQLSIQQIISAIDMPKGANVRRAESCQSAGPLHQLHQYLSRAANENESTFSRTMISSFLTETGAYRTADPPVEVAAMDSEEGENWLG